LQELEELRLDAYENSRLYKEKTKNAKEKEAARNVQLMLLSENFSITKNAASYLRTTIVIILLA